MPFLKSYWLQLVLGVLIVLMGTLNPVFLSGQNLMNIINQISIIGLVSLGMTLIIITGGIDLSVGAMVAFSGILLANFLLVGVPLPLCILVCLAIGSLIGAANGVLVATFKVPPFIATLGSMSVIRGGALLLTEGRSVSGIPNSLPDLVAGRCLGVPASIYIFAIVAILAWLFMTYTYWGRYIYAIGDNERAARLSGINIGKFKILVYTISGFLSAIGSVILVGKLSSAQPQAGNLYEMNAIAAVVIGGASLSGGRGSIINTVLGVLILGVLQNGLSILNTPVYYQQIIIGVVVILSVVIDSQTNRKQRI